jgi:hypothetical protein
MATVISIGLTSRGLAPPRGEFRICPEKEKSGLFEPTPERIVDQFPPIDPLFALDIELTMERMPDVCPLLWVVVEHPNARRYWFIPHADRFLFVSLADRLEFSEDRVSKMPPDGCTNVPRQPQ